MNGILREEDKRDRKKTERGNLSKISDKKLATQKDAA
jgi:hypothetical protein